MMEAFPFLFEKALIQTLVNRTRNVWNGDTYDFFDVHLELLNRK